MIRTGWVECPFVDITSRRLGSEVEGKLAWGTGGHPKIVPSLLPLCAIISFGVRNSHNENDRFQCNRIFGFQETTFIHCSFEYN